MASKSGIQGALESSFFVALPSMVGSLVDEKGSIVHMRMEAAVQ